MPVEIACRGVKMRRGARALPRNEPWLIGAHMPDGDIGFASHQVVDIVGHDDFDIDPRRGLIEPLQYRRQCRWP